MYIVVQVCPVQNSFAAPNVFMVHRKIRRIMAQLLWGGHATLCFKMDYDIPLFISFAIFFDGSSSLIFSLILVLTSSEWLFVFSSILFWSTLSSQDDPATL